LATQGGIVIGSAPNQRFTGKSGGKSIKAWKLDLKQQGGVDVTGGGAFGVAVTRFIATTKGKNPVEIPYVTFYVYVMRMTGGGSVSPDFAIAKFAIAN
jgi:hypothetical protein